MLQRDIKPVRRFVRMELVERVKAEIAAGTYETSGRMEAAMERLLDEVTGTL